MNLFGVIYWMCYVLKNVLKYKEYIQCFILEKQKNTYTTAKINTRPIKIETKMITKR